MTDTDLNKIMSQCRCGFPKHMIDESNNLHADCYGAIGWLRNRVKELEKQLEAALKVTTQNTIRHIDGKP